MTAILQLARDYLALRRSFGYRLVEPGRLVMDFAEHLDQHDVGHVSVEAALSWATAPGASPYWHWYRLCAVRGFAAYLHAFDDCWTTGTRCHRRTCWPATTIGWPRSCSPMRTWPR